MVFNGCFNVLFFFCLACLCFLSELFVCVFHGFLHGFCLLYLFVLLCFMEKILGVLFVLGVLLEGLLFKVCWTPPCSHYIQVSSCF